MLMLVDVDVGPVDVFVLHVFGVPRGSLLYFIWAFVAAWQSNIQMFHNEWLEAENDPFEKPKCSLKPTHPSIS